MTGRIGIPKRKRPSPRPFYIFGAGSCVSPPKGPAESCPGARVSQAGSLNSRKRSTSYIATCSQTCFDLRPAPINSSTTVFSWRNTGSEFVTRPIHGWNICQAAARSGLTCNGASSLIRNTRPSRVRLRRRLPGKRLAVSFWTISRRRLDASLQRHHPVEARRDPFGTNGMTTGMQTIAHRGSARTILVSRAFKFWR